MDKWYSCLFAGNRRWQDNRGKSRGSRKQNAVPNAHVRSEIKDFEHIRKERQKKADRISHMKSKSAKGGRNFGKNGKRGKAKR